MPSNLDVHALGHLARDEHSPARWAAMVALGVSDDPVAESMLLELRCSRDAFVRRAAVEALGARARSAGGAEAVLAALDDPNGVVVRAACAASASLGLEEAVPRLVSLLRAHDDTAADALLALGELPCGSQAFDAVLDRFDTARSETLRRRAAWTLIAHADQSRWRALFDRWRGDGLHQHRVWACRLAERYADASVLPLLVALSEDADGHVRKAAVRAVHAASAR